MLTYPAGATHFRFIQALSVLSDFAYDACREGYQPVETALNEESVNTFTKDALMEGDVF